MMRLLTILLVTAALAAPAAAQGRNGCPPGLARKSPACVPPGQAKKMWREGDLYDGPWAPVDWWEYDLPRPRAGETWVRVGDDLAVRVDDVTRAVVQIIALAAAVLGN
jgi:Ni/Co efflux regulator RcnB